MSLEFAVQFPCILRARYSEKHLRDWGRLSSLHARLTTGDASAPSDEKIQWVENVPGWAHGWPDPVYDTATRQAVFSRLLDE